MLYEAAVKDVERAIRESIHDSNVTFVFPSEIAAAFWRHASLDLTGLSAVRSDRFVSWDVFKERCFELGSEKVPSNMAIRMLFSSALLAENLEEGFLQGLILPAYAAEASRFVTPIARMLPSLAELRQEKAAGRIELDEQSGRDLDYLWHRYNEFLISNGLFEPGYARVNTPSGDEVYHIFHPSVIADFGRYASVLVSERFRLHDTASGDDVAIRQFDNAHSEVAWVCRSLGELLERGVAHNRMAVTLAPSDWLEEALYERALRMGLPLDFRLGKPLSTYRESRIFPLLLECASGGFGTDALKALFLDRAIPWKDERTSRALVDFGIEHFGLRNYREGGSLRNLWKEKLAVFADPDMRRFYAALSARIAAIGGAKDFRALHREVHAFNSAFLSTDRFSEVGLRAVQASLDVLNDLVALQERMPGVEVTSPFALWQAVLATREYVPRRATAGIPVYEYRVSAGICPDYHFIIGASHESTLLSQSRFAFLPEYARSSGAGEEDFTERFLSLYQRSGKQVLISCSREGFGGPSLAPAYFVAKNLVEPAPHEPDPFGPEQLLWIGGDEESRTTGRLFPAQARGFAFLDRTGLQPKGVDFTTSRISDNALADELAACQEDERGYVRVSATSLDGYEQCGFHYLIAHVLEVGRPGYDVSLSDAAEIGTIIHAVLSELFRHLRERPGSFGAVSEQTLKSLLSQSVEAVLDDRQRRHPIFLPPIWRDTKEYLLRYLGQFLLREAEEYGELAVVDVERSLSFDLPPERLILNGRIDRISSVDDRYVLVDYKKRNWLSRREMKPSPEGMGSYQIPFYVLLCRSAVGEVAAASYYDIEGARYDHVYSELSGKSWLSGEELEEAVSMTTSAARSMADAVRSGQYTTRGSTEVCSGCELRNVCRTRYVVR